MTCSAAYHEYFILVLDTVHDDCQRCKTVRYTVKDNRLIVWFWLLEGKLIIIIMMMSPYYGEVHHSLARLTL